MASQTEEAEAKRHAGGLGRQQRRAEACRGPHRRWRGHGSRGRDPQEVSGTRRNAQQRPEDEPRGRAQWRWPVERDGRQEGVAARAFPVLESRRHRPSPLIRSRCSRHSCRRGRAACRDRGTQGGCCRWTRRDTTAATSLAYCKAGQLCGRHGCRDVSAQFHSAWASGQEGRAGGDRTVGDSGRGRGGRTVRSSRLDLHELYGHGPRTGV